MQLGGTLIVVGSGIEWGGQMTLAAKTAIEKADRVLFAVADEGTVRWIRSLCPSSESLPYPRDGRPRRQIYREMVERILEEVRKGHKVCAVFYGHPGVLADAPHEAVRRAREEGHAARMLPGVSFLDCLFCDLGVDPGKAGCQLFEAGDFLARRPAFDTRVPLILCQIGMIGNRKPFEAADDDRIRSGLEALAGALGEGYAGEHEAVIYEASVHPLEPPLAERVRVRDLARAAVSDVSTLYVPARPSAQPAG